MLASMDQKIGCSGAVSAASMHPPMDPCARLNTSKSIQKYSSGFVASD